MVARSTQYWLPPKKMMSAEKDIDTAYLGFTTSLKFYRKVCRQGRRMRWDDHIVKLKDEQCGFMDWTDAKLRKTCKCQKYAESWPPETEGACPQDPRVKSKHHQSSVGGSLKESSPLWPSHWISNIRSAKSSRTKRLKEIWLVHFLVVFVSQLSFDSSRCECQEGTLY